MSARIQAKLGNGVDGPSGQYIAETRPITDARIPPASGPTDELWNLKSALQMVSSENMSEVQTDIQGEPTHVAIRRIQLAQSRFVSTKLRDEKLLSGWAGEHAFDEGAWHASQAGLWAMIGEFRSFREC